MNKNTDHNSGRYFYYFACSTIFANVLGAVLAISERTLRSIWIFAFFVPSMNLL
ncbi:MAG: hypothetical protein UX58_C0006G0021 [Candidatus Wolfebacteria bacterium GW2011_GWB2_46_69]|nr:MAG: hypothetical protein UX58_C0006G0021 [Candidatus Wolfebacteria bacterium GW2011_GWB2_46_69]KKU53994.1 MAG: hypothetical protein UX76_C0007G0053 [Candidatus Wolfebacteria bacterium GW2011_GWC1_47_103]